MKKRSQKDHKILFFYNSFGNFEGLLEFVLEIFLGAVLEPKNGTPEWPGCGRRRPRGGQNEEGFGSGQEFPPSVQIYYRNLCRMSCSKGLQMPLAAGLAAAAGGLGSLEALAVHGCPTPLGPGVLIRCRIFSAKVQAPPKI